MDSYFMEAKERLKLITGYASGIFCVEFGCDLSQFHLSVTVDSSSQMRLVKTSKAL